MTLTPTEGTPGCGPHACEPDPTTRHITWQPATRPEQRRRVLRWTCECRPTVYYLVSAAGRGYIERTRRGHPTTQTERMSHSDTATLWEHILLGQAV
ncbi:hypothetical protein Sme01_34460 [Sphaerisporangium melleum]|uniref:Uncharacterized protein n=1 Tax=Sphaerisporangium melleum TaxID=321316 RepID=A0A917QYA8_9ACTN|nr:hypothetical protein [Sphaerisporangium melleum]GGK74861.1 hypothetical protein GCM10007964_17140 [Sphaerisporangium melleum]GII70970.1 hypothetical protein Sme01_34460 [Sphaerisporangium melleum]